MFSERLKECRKTQGKTQKEVALHLKIAERAYQNYEYGNREPSIATLVNIADFLQVSLDYLTDRTDDPAVHQLED